MGEKIGKNRALREMGEKYAQIKKLFNRIPY
jgi:hypothetical protein